MEQVFGDAVDEDELYDLIVCFAHPELHVVLGLAVLGLTDAFVVAGVAFEQFLVFIGVDFDVVGCREHAQAADMSEGVAYLVLVFEGVRLHHLEHALHHLRTDGDAAVVVLADMAVVLQFGHELGDEVLRFLLGLCGQGEDDAEGEDEQSAGHGSEFFVLEVLQGVLRCDAGLAQAVADEFQGV